MTTVEPPSHRYNREVRVHQAYVDGYARDRRKTIALRVVSMVPLPLFGVLLGAYIAVRPGWPYLLIGMALATLITGASAGLEVLTAWTTRFAAWRLEWSTRRLDWLSGRSAVHSDESATDGLDTLKGTRAGNTAVVRSLAYVIVVAVANAFVVACFAVVSTEVEPWNDIPPWLFAGLLAFALSACQFWTYRRMTKAVDAVVQEARVQEARRGSAA